MTAALANTACTRTVNEVSPEENLPGYLKITSSGAAKFLYIGSAIQWNKDYAISAAHIPMLSSVVHHCSTGCDLVFIRHDANGTLPTWRKAIAGEPVKTVGQAPLFRTVQGKGTSKLQRIRIKSRHDRTVYALSDAPIVEGMSGGPVYGEDAAIIGMIVGTYVSPIPPRPNSNTLTVYVPYEIIRHEWDIFYHTIKDKKDGKKLKTDNLP